MNFLEFHPDMVFLYFLGFAFESGSGGNRIKRRKTNTDG